MRENKLCMWRIIANATSNCISAENMVRNMVSRPENMVRNMVP